MDWHEFVFLFEAIIYLAVARFCIYFLPLKWYVDKLGSDTPDVLAQDNRSNSASTHNALLIRKAISRAANNMPWNTVCLPQAIAAKWMCQRRNIKSVMYLGVAKNTAPSPSEHAVNAMFSKPTSIKAHAWLKVEDTIITGKVGHKKFTVLKTFY
ncbi:lasso peptide biosynthesis B2 protein [Alteromonas sp. a30]|uniref:lasso peptide biosynthesis B2 protein n=1 Tax=Alteromonas sp. a30 TaxID=2730917 RepID=UPI00227EF6D4|nr:lasso peptide biosynthesis B2 protein [Alteromonas sp. a30]MCY7296709.1 lasso peptide biosynthesis B2 protein [Alteromonas sp. a30]